MAIVLPVRAWRMMSSRMPGGNASAYGFFFSPSSYFSHINTDVNGYVALRWYKRMFIDRQYSWRIRGIPCLSLSNFSCNPSARLNKISHLMTNYRRVKKVPWKITKAMIIIMIVNFSFRVSWHVIFCIFLWSIVEYEYIYIYTYICIYVHSEYIVKGLVTIDFPVKLRLFRNILASFSG